MKQMAWIEDRPNCTASSKQTPFNQFNMHAKYSILASWTSRHFRFYITACTTKNETTQKNKQTKNSLCYNGNVCSLSSISTWRWDTLTKSMQYGKGCGWDYSPPHADTSTHLYINTPMPVQCTLHMQTPTAALQQLTPPERYICFPRPCSPALYYSLSTLSCMPVGWIREKERAKCNKKRHKSWCQ